MMSVDSLFTSFLLGTMFFSATVSAQSQAEARLREALRSTATQLRALEEERSRWQVTEAEQKKEIDALQAKLAASNRTCRERKPSPELTRRLDEQLEANQKLTASLAECQTAGQKAADKIQSNEEQVVQVTRQADLFKTRITACEEKNARIYQLGRDLVARFEHEGFGDALLLSVEPVLGLKRVERENVAQDFQDKLLEQKVQP